MSEIVGSAVGGFVGGLAGTVLTQKTITTSVAGKVQLEPYRFYGVKFLRITSNPTQILSEALAVKSILLKADKNNSAPVWIGRADVTKENGFPLDPGDTLSMSVNNANDVYAMAEGTQKLYVVFLGE